MPAGTRCSRTACTHVALLTYIQVTCVGHVCCQKPTALATARASQRQSMHQAGLCWRAALHNPACIPSFCRDQPDQHAAHESMYMKQSDQIFSAPGQQAMCQAHVAVGHRCRCCCLGWPTNGAAGDRHSTWRSLGLRSAAVQLAPPGPQPALMLHSSHRPCLPCHTTQQPAMHSAAYSFRCRYSCRTCACLEALLAASMQATR